jgi:hypothetical protein
MDVFIVGGSWEEFAWDDKGVKRALFRFGARSAGRRRDAGDRPGPTSFDARRMLLTGKCHHHGREECAADKQQSCLLSWSACCEQSTMTFTELESVLRTMINFNFTGWRGAAHMNVPSL